MKASLQRINNAVHFEASSELSDVKANIDGSEAIAGEGKGVRPMELALMALGAWSVCELTTILQKQRQDMQDIQVEVAGERRDEIPNVFTKIHISFSLKGNIDEIKAQKAAELAVRKYCSVHDMLAAGGIDITYSIKIN